MTQLDDLIETVAGYTSAPEAPTILTAAFQIASQAHDGYKRINGEPFITHPLAVARILAGWHAPWRIVAASLLHDMQNLTYSHSYPRESMQASLGPAVFRLLPTIVDLNRLFRDLERDFSTGVNYQQQYIYQVLQYDYEVIVLKLADRLHNLQTIAPLARDFQGRAVRIGFNVLAPLAEKLGMGEVKRHLEDYCFEVFNPAAYSAVKQLYDAVQFQQDIQVVLGELRLLLPACQVRWQPVSLYTLYYRQIEQNVRLGRPARAHPAPLRIGDAGSFIVVADGESACYQVLGTLHRSFPPLERQFRDFIGQPRENGYQSLHTQVKHASCGPCCLVLRTHFMDLLAEQGIVSRWWGVPEHLLPVLPAETGISEKIQVITPSGKIVYLPEGASVLDFAYAIHGDLGHRCAGALVNGKQEGRFALLHAGDRVEVISGAVDPGPDLSWLDQVRTAQATHQIRQRVAHEQRSAMIERGHLLLNKEIEARNLNPNDAQIRELLLVLANKEGFEQVEDLLVSIGVGRHTSSRLVEQLKSMRLRLVGPPNYGELPVSIAFLAPEGKEALLPVTFARCCKPFPPDDIVGQRRDDNMLVIHKSACAHIQDQKKAVPVQWDTTPIEPDYVVVVEALDRPSLASDLSTIMALSGVDMASFSTCRRADGVMAEAHIHLSSTTTARRARLQKELEHIAYISRVEMIPSAFLTSAFTHPAAATSARHAYHPNPYGPTVASGERFYGRKAECQRVCDLLYNAAQNTTILLWGQRRIGKTSLMLHLREQLRADLLPVYIDVQGLTDSSTAQFLHRFMSQVATTLKGREPASEITVPALNRVRRDPLSYFDTFIDLVQQVAPRHLLVIMLDEFQCLGSLREEVASREAIFGRLRSYAQHGRGMRFILCGGGQKSQLLSQGNIASLFHIACDEQVSCLEREAGSRLVKNGLTKVGNITAHAIEMLLDLTAGHPYYLQLLCSMLYEQALEQKVTVTADLVSQYVRRWLEKADSGRFQHLWEGRTQEHANINKVILSAIAEFTLQHAQMEYGYLAGKLGSRIPERSLVQALSDLSDLDILEHDHASYRIKIGLFARWLRQHWPLEITLKEIY
ncbi:MAG TPA: HD domain-containing protein [Ktedonobacteraceae bacterium]|jgi:(p)ppGpp synthase/HD superfamily hydrolase